MKKDRGFAVVILIIVVLLVLAGVGFYFLIFQKNKVGLKQATLSPSPSPAVAEKANPTPTVVMTVTPTPQEPVVVFEAAGSFSQSEKDLIKQKVINPFIDYNQDLVDQASIVSITISHSSTPGFPYSVSAVFANGGTSGFLVSGSGGDIDWWLPDCMGPCPFTQSFKDKYPEIVSQLE